MRKTALMVRCVPRYGFDNTEVRTVDLDVPRDADERTLHEALTFYFAGRGISDAVYDIGVDDNGFFAIVNDEAYEVPWGTPLL
ncbi:MAG: hypothetical protein AB1601_04060 [Planctomycetota bacterium]|jgi:hypothetical protein